VMAYYIASTRIGRHQPDEGHAGRRASAGAVVVPAGLFHAVDPAADQSQTVCGFDLVRTGMHVFPDLEFTGRGANRWCDDCRVKAVAYPTIDAAGSP